MIFSLKEPQKKEGGVIRPQEKGKQFSRPCLLEKVRGIERVVKVRKGMAISLTGGALVVTHFES